MEIELLNNDEPLTELNDDIPPDDVVDAAPEVEDESELVITLGDEPTDSEADSGEDIYNEKPEDTEWLKNLRKLAREKAKEVRELKKENEQLKNSTQKPVELPPLPKKPSIWDEDINGDEVLFEEKLDAWKAEKKKRDDFEESENEKRRIAQEEDEKQIKAFQEKENAYKSAKLAVPDFEAAESDFDGMFSEIQKKIIIDLVKDPKALIYALGKNSKIAKELADNSHPARFIFALSKIEEKLKMTTKPKAPSPEKMVKSNAGVSGNSIERQLDKLRAEAQKTGNVQPILDFKRKNGLK